MNLPVTSMIAAMLAIVMVPLTVHISVRRAFIGIKSGQLNKAVFGDVGDALLRNSIRAFGNFIEYVPTVLVLFSLMEIQGASSNLLWWLGGCFVVGRIIHGLSMTFIPSIPAPRGLAMFATYAALLVPAWWLLTH